MTYVDHIIDEVFGGTRPAARALGENPSTVQGWKVRGRIPAKKQSHVLETGKRLGKDIDHSSFFEPSDHQN